MIVVIVQWIGKMVHIVKMVRYGLLGLRIVQSLVKRAVWMTSWDR